MFERYNEDAKRTLFFARQAISEHGGTQIEPEHLLMGLLAAHPRAVVRFASGFVAVDDIRQRLIAVIASENRLPESHEVRFSTESVAALERAQIEADDLSDAMIRAEHLMLGVLVRTDSQATTVMRDAGIRVSAIREALSSPPAE